MDASDRRERAGSEASDWFARLQSGAMERAEREQFVEWLRESHVHVAAMLRMAQIHGSLANFELWTRIRTGPKSAADDVIHLPAVAGDDTRNSLELDPNHPQPRRRRAVQRLRLYGIAATVMVVVAATLLLPRFRGQVIETERGERREVVLGDGSLLQVDSKTSLRVKYTDSMRAVFLEHGRALFHVAKSPQRPFLVYADGTAVRAVGTVFGVEQRNEGVVVTVAEGKVAVNLQGASGVLSPRALAPSAAAEAARPNASQSDDLKIGTGDVVTLPPNPLSAQNTFFLIANQQVTVASSGSAQPVREVDSDRALAWAEGRLIFQNDDLGQAVAEFNRYNRVQLRVIDSALAAKPVSGVFNAAEPEAFIAFLQSVTAVEIVRDGDRSITIGPKRSH